MVDAIDKALNKLPDKTKTELKAILNLIKQGKLSELKLKKLRGYKDIYRVRKGKMRIIFKKTKTEINVISVERRSDHTYK